MGFSGFYIDGQKIRDPNKFREEYYTLTQTTRIANGDITMDYVANKRKFSLTWNVASSKQLSTMINLLWRQLVTTRNCFHTLTFTSDEGPQTCTIYAGSIKRNLARGDNDTQWIWKDITVDLIEQ